MALTFVRFPRFVAIFLVAVLAACVLIAPWSVSAENLQVNANVNHDSPSQPAEFQPGLDGSEAIAALVTVSGTCQQLTPGSIVSLWRDGVLLGSSPCDGNFNIQAMMRAGINNLIARTSNVQGLYGPDSQSIVITYGVPAQPAPTMPPAGSDEPPSSTVETKRATDLSLRSGLMVRPSEAFGVLSDANGATVKLIITGGTPEYGIGLNWGNGTTQSHVLSAEGAYAYEGQYEDPGVYAMRGRIRDSRGAYAEFSYALVSQVNRGPGGEAAGPPQSSGQEPSDIGGFLQRNIPALAVGTSVTIVIGAVTFMAFRMGEVEAVRLLRRSGAESGSGSQSNRAQAKKSKIRAGRP